MALIRTSPFLDEPSINTIQWTRDLHYFHYSNEAGGYNLTGFMPSTDATAQGQIIRKFNIACDVML
jgi:hypothetical protein